MRDDADRETFVRSLAEASERSGFRVHAFVLMTNHYHLLLETPQANLPGGWDGCRTSLRAHQHAAPPLGHLFGGRYKAILAEPGNCFWALLDYIHLNPVRARIVQEKDGIECYAWSSLPHYLGPPRRRPAWVETAAGFEVCGCADTASGRREVVITSSKSKRTIPLIFRNGITPRSRHSSTVRSETLAAAASC